jgi:NADH dehydrogenase
VKVAITGGTGFVGGHLAESLLAKGHEVVLLARGRDRRPWARKVLDLPGIAHRKVGIGDPAVLAEVFAGCDAVAHCAGINTESGGQTYRAVHVTGTENVVRAAEEAGVRRLALLSFLRARPDCDSAYHESKWAAEEIVRASTLEWTVLKPGMIFGRGDHMLDHLSHALHTFPVFLGMGPKRVRPLAVEDVVKVLEAALVDGRLPNRTVALMGPTELPFDDAAALIGRVIGVERPSFPVPSPVHYGLAWVAERVMKVPLVARAQVRILEEGSIDPARAPDPLPEDLVPSTPFDEDHIRRALPPPGRFGLKDLRLPRRWSGS